MRKHSILLGIAFLSSSIFHTSFASDAKTNEEFFDEAVSAWHIYSPLKGHDAVIPLNTVIRDGKGLSGITIDGTTDSPTPDYGEWCDYMHMHIIKYSPDGKSLAFIGRRNPKWERDFNVYAIKDGVTGKGYEEISYESPLYSPDGKNFAFLAREENGWFSVENGAEGKKRYNWAYSPTYKPDGHGFAFLGIRDWEVYMVSDWAESKISGVDLKNTDTTFHEYETHPIAFSTDGKRYAFILHAEVMSKQSGSRRSAKNYFVKDGAIQKEVPEKGTLRYSEKDQDFIITPNDASNHCGSWKTIQTAYSQNKTEVQKVLKTPAKDFKIITEAQKASLQRQAEKLTGAQLYALAEKVSTALESGNLTDDRRSLLQDVLYLLYISVPSDEVNSRKEWNDLFSWDDKRISGALNNQ